MKRYGIYYGNDCGHMLAPFGAIVEVSATSREEAAEKLGAELIPGTTKIVPNNEIKETINTLPFCTRPVAEIADNLVLVEVDEE